MAVRVVSCAESERDAVARWRPRHGAARLLRVLFVGLSALLLPDPVDAQEGAGGGERPLQREESFGAPAEDPLTALLEEEFRPRRWRERLRVPDLAVRERNFEVLLSRARLDPIARAFLEELARGSDELAWTARLALRELRVPGVPVPVGGLSAEAYQRRFAEAYRRLLGEHPELHFQVPDTPRGSEGQLPGEARAVVLLDVHLVQNESGAMVELTGEGQSGLMRRRFKGRTLMDIFDSQPELKRQVRISVGSLPKELDLRFIAPFVVGPAQESGGRGVPAMPPLAAKASPGGAAPPAGEDVESHFAPNKLVPVRTDVLGVVVEPVRGPEASALGIEQGLRVLRIEPGTIADRMGLRTGDILLEFDARPLRRPQDITDAMAARDRSDELVLIWLDDLNTPIRGTWKPDPR